METLLTIAVYLFVIAVILGMLVFVLGSCCLIIQEVWDAFEGWRWRHRK
jgi:hypothetical protein